MTEFQKFFLNDIPPCLKLLTIDTKACWGQMTAAEMLNHLRVAIKMSLENRDGEITTPEDKLPGFKKYLMSDKPFGQSLPAPNYFRKHTMPHPKDVDIEEIKMELLKDLLNLVCHFRKNQDHTSVHPTFGPLCVAEWEHLHIKHIRHHFIQFGLMDL